MNWLDDAGYSSPVSTRDGISLFFFSFTLDDMHGFGFGSPTRDPFPFRVMVRATDLPWPLYMAGKSWMNSLEMAPRWSTTS